MQKSFKEQKDGSFELLLDNQNSGIFFHIPPKCKMEDYNIVIIGQQLVSSSRAHFTLNNPPKDMGQIKINSEADIHFENNINIKVNKSLEIGRNNNLVINSYSKAELYFDELLITKNTNTEITLVAEGPRKVAVDYRQIPIAMSSIRNNNFCIFSLGTNVKKFDLANNSSTSQDIPFRASVARADYVIIDGNQVTPTSEDAIIMADVTGGFNLRHAKMTNIIHDLSLFVDNAGVEYTSLVCDKIQMNNSSSSGSLIKFIASNSSEAEAKTKIPIYLENIKLDSHACLEVNLNSDLSKEASIPVEFKNTNFNQYNTFEIDNGLSVENSSFKGLRFISSHDDKETISKIDNPIFKDIVRLHNISNVSFSEISNTDISNGKEVEINNEFIKDQRIGNYEDFAKNSQTRANFDRDSRITESLEVL